MCITNPIELKLIACLLNVHMGHFVRGTPHGAGVFLAAPGGDHARLDAQVNRILPAESRSRVGLAIIQNQHRLVLFQDPLALAFYIYQ